MAEENLSTSAAWELHRWETETRYYLLALQQNLFGQWEVVRAWGGRGTKLGAIRFAPASSYEEAVRAGRANLNTA